MARFKGSFMKRSLLIFIPFVLLGISCVAFPPMDGIVGNGKVVTAPLNVASFSSVKNECSADVRIHRGFTTSVSVTTDENVLEAFDVRVEDGTLVIGVKPNKSIFRTSAFRVDVYMPSIDRAVVHASGGIRFEDSFTEDAVELYILGSGSMSGSFDARSLSARIGASGSLSLSGSADSVVVVVAGSGSVKAGSLVAEAAEITVNASGSCTMRVDSSLDAAINGSGSIYYYGNPLRVRKSDNGSGSVVRL